MKMGRYCRKWEETMMVCRDQASPFLLDNAIAATLSGTFPRRDTTRSSFTSDGAADRSKGRGNIGALHFGRRWKNKRQEVDGDLVELYANHLHGASQRTLLVRLGLELRRTALIAQHSIRLERPLYLRSESGPAR